MRNVVLFLWCFLLFHTALSGQCPDKAVLWQRIVYLRDSSSVPPATQLTELLQSLKDIKGCPNYNDSTHALLLQRIGWLTSVQKDFTKAVSYTLQSIAIINNQPNNPGINRKHLVKFYNNLRIFYDSLNQPSLVAAAIDSCISLAVNLKTGYEYAVPLIYVKTQNLYEIGDYYQCINYAIIGENIARTSGYDTEHMYFYLSWRINALIFLGRLDEAELLLQKTIRECLKADGRVYLGSLYGAYARINIERVEVQKALENSRKSFNYDKQTKNYNGCASSLNNIGELLYFRKLHQYDLALQYNRSALQYADAIESLNILENMANVQVEKGAYDSAFYFFQAAFDKLSPGIDENTLLRREANQFSNRNFTEYLVGLILDKADAFLKKYKANKNREDLKKALQVYKVADLYLNKIKSEQSAVQSRLFWRREARRLYEHGIEASWLDQDLAKAFYFFEKSRAVLLNDQLNEQSRISEDDLKKQASIQRKIIQLQTQLDTTEASSLLHSDIQTLIFSKTLELSRIKGMNKDRHSSAYQDLIDTAFITLDDVRKKILIDHQALVELFEGDSAVYSLLITPVASYQNKIDKKDFDSTARLYLSYVSNVAELNSRFNEFLLTARHLYNILFGNLRLPQGRLIISPDGPYFPFEALVQQVINGEPEFFLKDHSVSYTYSARFLTYDFGVSMHGGAGSFLGVAPVAFHSKTSFSPLSGSDESLNRIGPHFANAHQLISTAASKDNFLKAYSNYRIIQLYTHASDSSEHGEPVIQFADSPLYLSDIILDARPLTRLVSLSACETGNGQLYRGEGVFSFNRAFAAMGIPASLTNLWAVDSKSTYELTELFYKFLSEGMPSDVALQKAKLSFIKSYSGEEKSLPYYWAATILAGKAEVLTEKGYPAWYYIAGFAGLAVAILFIWIYRRRREK